MSKTAIIIIAVVTLVTVAIGLFYYFFGNAPQQPYTAIRKAGNVEIRYYPLAWIATVASKEPTYKSNSGNFRRLASYIFGGNQSKEKIAMTAPVYMDFESNKSKMSFVMPQGYNLNNLPVPLSQEIQLHQTEPAYVAVLRFGGYASDEKIEQKKNELVAQLKSLGIDHGNEVRYLGYNAPWDIVFRRNEVLVSIGKDEALK